MAGAREGALEAGRARVVPYEGRFEPDLVEICWRTGLMGESLEGTGRFEDRRLFAMLFCLPYASFEPGSCFVALAPRDPARPEAGERAVGYIVGSSRAAAQARDFGRRWKPRIAARLFLYDWWRHPESFAQALRFARVARAEEAAAANEAGAGRPLLGGPEFPAVLHINLLPEWQGRGLGGLLMAAFLGRLRELGCRGVYLETSERNLKALPFYRKLGFEEPGGPSGAAPEPGEFWAGLPARGIAMTLVLTLPGAADSL